MNFNATGPQPSQHWNQIESVQKECQTDALDSMRRMILLFQEVADEVREQVLESEMNARSRIGDWERSFRYQIWTWDATAYAIKDAEHRSRMALEEGNTRWREYIQEAFSICHADISIHEKIAGEFYPSSPLSPLSPSSSPHSATTSSFSASAAASSL